ncbi:unnamed protein product [Mesocestoides corti]|uniref:Uncharacterized protein n=1 Tax=Mesocestoides corti TaxID=53468 RepID=A0A0R3UB14_MESCO|nr:unnamed protein product [Mesocestoides corti]
MGNSCNDLIDAEPHLTLLSNQAEVIAKRFSKDVRASFGDPHNRLPCMNFQMEFSVDVECDDDAQNSTLPTLDFHRQCRYVLKEFIQPHQNVYEYGEQAVCILCSVDLQMKREVFAAPLHNDLRLR